MFNRISAVILLVSDIDRSIRFYRDVLGMEMKQHSPDWVEFSKSGSTVLALHPAKKNVATNSSMLVGFSFSDLDSVYQDLKEKNVDIYKDLTTEKFGKHAIIKDPDGHLLSLVEMIPKDEFMQSPYYYGFAPI